MRLIVLLITVCACIGLIGCASIEPGDLSAVAPISANARAGNAYLLRGFIGIFSSGIDQLGDEVNDSGIHAMVFQDDQWSAVARTIGAKYSGVINPEPLMLIGHSYGADDVIRIARELKKRNIQVDLLITLDPVTPPAVPSNVRTCINLYQSNGAWDSLPWLRGVPLEPERGKQGTATRLINYNIRTERTDLLEPGLDHFNIEKKQKVHDEILRHVLSVCPTRTEWATRVAPRTPAVSPSAASAVNSSSALPSLMTPLKRPAVPGRFAAATTEAASAKLASDDRN